MRVKRCRYCRRVFTAPGQYLKDIKAGRNGRPIPVYACRSADKCNKRRFVLERF